MTLCWCRRWRAAAGVHVRDAGAVRGLAAEQAASRRAGRLPRRAGAQGNAAGAASPPPHAAAAAAAARSHLHPLPPLGAPASSQLSRRASLPQLLLSHSPRFGYRLTLPNYLLLVRGVVWATAQLGALANFDSCSETCQCDILKGLK